MYILVITYLDDKLYEICIDETFSRNKYVANLRNPMYIICVFKE